MCKMFAEKKRDKRTLADYGNFCRETGHPVLRIKIRFLWDDPSVFASVATSPTLAGEAFSGHSTLCPYGVH